MSGVLILHRLSHIFRIVEQASREVLNTVGLSTIKYMTSLETKKQEFFAVIFKVGMMDGTCVVLTGGQDPALKASRVQLFQCDSGDVWCLVMRIVLLIR